MATGLLTSTGFDPKRLVDVKADLETAFRNEFGQSLNLGADTPEGKIVGMLSDRLTTLWERAETLYDALYPAGASGVSLDRLAELTNVLRVLATRSTVTIYVRGSLATIPVGSLVENVDTGIQFQTKVEVTIPAGGDIPLTAGSSLSITTITRVGTVATATTAAPHGLPNGAVVTVSGANEADYNATAEIQNVGASTFDYNMNADPGSSATGTLVFQDEALASDHITFATAVARAIAHGLSTADFVFVHDATETEYNGLFSVTVLDVDHFEYTPLTLPTVTPATGSFNADDAIAVTAEGSATGPLLSLAGKLTIIVTPISGWDAVSNFLDAVPGLNEESDVTFRARRLAALAGLGNATVDAIRGDMLTVVGVTTSIVFENELDVTVNGRPPHTIEVLVEGGVDLTIAQAIWDSKAGGIRTFGTSSAVATDDQGNPQTMFFTRPSDLDIFLELDLTVDSTFLADPAGDNAVEAAILAFGTALLIGEDVVVFPYLIGAIENVAGILDVVVRIGTAASPTLDDNIIVSETQRAKFDSTRITIVSLP